MKHRFLQPVRNGGELHPKPLRAQNFCLQRDFFTTSGRMATNGYPLQGFHAEQPLTDGVQQRQSRGALVHGVEMQTRRAAVFELLAQVTHHL